MVLTRNDNGAGPSNQAGQQQGNYREAHKSYVVFVTEPTDRRIVRQRALEVNAVIPAVPKFLLWSEMEITWSRKDHPRVMPKPGAYA